MNKKMKRIVSFALTVFLIFTSTCFVFATDSVSDSTEEVKLTNDLVIQMAERFAAAVNPDLKLSADNPIKFYDESGQAIGYIVNYYYNALPYGYVIFDTTNSSIISEYSICENAKNPYEVITEQSVSLYKSNNYEDSKLYKISPFTYGIINSEGNIVNNYGETTSDSIEIQSGNRSVKPSSWDDVFISIQAVYEDYTLVSTNHLEQFISFNQEYIKNTTKHYACAVSASLACAAYYQAVNYSNISEDYMGLWAASGTNTSRVASGITYGETNPNNIGPGLVEFCNGKGIYIMEFTRNSPQYSVFTDCIDSGNIAIMSCAILSSDNEKEGHAMAVEGYAALKANNSGKNVRTLMVFDGWGDNVRYLNYDFNNWVRTGGITFNG